MFIVIVIMAFIAGMLLPTLNKKMIVVFGSLCISNLNPNQSLFASQGNKD